MYLTSLITFLRFFSIQRHRFLALVPSVFSSTPKGTIGSSSPSSLKSGKVVVSTRDSSTVVVSVVVSSLSEPVVINSVLGDSGAPVVVSVSDWAEQETWNENVR